MGFETLLAELGGEVEDAEEETFLLFSQDIPSQNLGFVDSKAPTIELTVAGREFTIHQSPALLTSNRSGGTTGAVIWKITPLFAEWLASSANPLFRTGFVDAESAVLELGCGISGLVGLVLAPSVSKYVLTDQPYVSKYVEMNLSENLEAPRSRGAASRRKGKQNVKTIVRDLTFTPLDWELDQVTSALTGSDDVASFDLVIACDCIYNESLIRPLVQTCVAACKLRDVDQEGGRSGKPTLCIVAQQLRNPEIFEGWMKEFAQFFRTRRVPNTALTDGLRDNRGFVIHLGLLREQAPA